MLPPHDIEALPPSRIGVGKAECPQPCRDIRRLEKRGRIDLGAGSTVTKPMFGRMVLVSGPSRGIQPSVQPRFRAPDVDRSPIRRHRDSVGEPRLPNGLLCADQESRPLDRPADFGSEHFGGCTAPPPQLGDAHARRHL